MKRTLLVLSLLILPLMTYAEPIKVLLVSGQNNHNWQQTSSLLWAMLSNYDEIFVTDIASMPPREAPQEAKDRFDPKFHEYDVVLMDYNGEDWSAEIKRRFEIYVRGGGGVVNIHAANNPFSSWVAWNEMIGLGWRNNNFGDRIFFEERGNRLERVMKGLGLGAGHGRVHQWNIINKDNEHPINEGMPVEWAHAPDELYHGQRGPAENMHVIQIAYSTEDSGGSGKYEPITWEIPYGAGTVITCVMGHWWGNKAVYGENNMLSLRCAGFQTTVMRSLEYAATGNVERVGIPEDFPTKDEISVRP